MAFHLQKLALLDKIGYLPPAEFERSREIQKLS